MIDRKRLGNFREVVLAIAGPSWAKVTSPGRWNRVNPGAETANIDAAIKTRGPGNLLFVICCGLF